MNKQTIKSKRFYLAAALAMLICALAGCTEDDAEIMFRVISNSNPEDVRVEYISLAPPAFSKDYTIYAYSGESELVLKALNVPILAIADGASHTYCDDEEGCWRAEVCDDNCLRIKLSPIDLSEFDGDGCRTFLKITDGKIKKERKTTIIIVRTNKRDN